MKTTFSRTFAAFAVILLTALLLVGISFQMLAKNRKEMPMEIKITNSVTVIV